jgi:hypothetical protein
MDKFQELILGIEQRFLHEIVLESDLQGFISQSMVMDAKYKENHVLKILGRFMKARSALK